MVISCIRLSSMCLCWRSSSRIERPTCSGFSEFVRAVAPSWLADAVSVAFAFDMVELRNASLLSFTFTYWEKVVGWVLPAAAVLLVGVLGDALLLLPIDARRFFSDSSLAPFRFTKLGDKAVSPLRSSWGVYGPWLLPCVVPPSSLSLAEPPVKLSYSRTSPRKA